MSKQQIFISYSRRDKIFVDRLMSNLEDVGFNLWRDTENLEAGTPSWERAIREAIQEAGAIILVASPDALKSDFVQGEIGLSRLYNCPIFPIWAQGEQWINCVPLDMVNYQYVDGRDPNYAAGLDELMKGLSKLFDISEGSITLGLPTHEKIEVNLAQFETGFNILSYVWLNHLQGWYDPFSYGREWIIANVHTKQIAMPWQWLTIDASNPEAVMQMNLLAGSISYIEFGIHSNSYWAIWDARRLRASALFLNDDNLRNHLLSRNGLSDIPALVKAEKLQRQAISETNPMSYKHKIVIAAFSDEDDRICFTES